MSVLLFLRKLLCLALLLAPIAVLFLLSGKDFGIFLNHFIWVFRDTYFIYWFSSSVLPFSCSFLQFLYFLFEFNISFFYYIFKICAFICSAPTAVIFIRNFFPYLLVLFWEFVRAARFFISKVSDCIFVFFSWCLFIWKTTD